MPTPKKKTTPKKTVPKKKAPAKKKAVAAKAPVEVIEQRVLLTPSSICMVVTGRLLQEFNVAVRSFRLQHPDIPIMVAADEPTSAALKAEPPVPNMIVGITFTQNDMAQILQRGRMPERLINSGSHPPAVLFFKMEILKLAITEFGDSMFVDADTIFMDKIEFPVWASTELALSPRYGTVAQDQFGKYNGGMVWSNAIESAQKWQDLYVNGDGFLDEGCLNEVAGEEPHTVTFDRNQNHGPWRLAPPEKVKLFHCHLDPEVVNGINDEDYRSKTIALATEIKRLMENMGILWDWNTTGVLRFKDSRMKSASPAQPAAAPIQVAHKPPTPAPTPIPTQAPEAASTNGVPPMPAAPSDRVEQVNNLAPPAGLPAYVVPFFKCPGSGMLAQYSHQMFAPGGVLFGKNNRSLVVEVAFGQDPFEVWDPSINVLQLRSSSLMWQKEAMINIGFRYLAAQGHTMLGYLDCDIRLGVPTWEDQVPRLIGRAPLQLFDYITHEFSDTSDATFGAASDFSRRKINPQLSAKAGGGWVYTKDFLDRSKGLYDRAIVGGGDTLNWLALHEGSFDRGFLWAGLTNMREAAAHYEEWSATVRGICEGVLPQYLPNVTALSQAHGTKESRKYLERHALLDEVGYNPATMVDHDANGLLRWTAEAPELLQSNVSTYLAARGVAVKRDPSMGPSDPTDAGIAVVGNSNCWAPIE